MTNDFSKFFEQYEQLAAEVDKIVDRVAAEYPDCITCTQGCSDCCHAMFDLTLLEALYLNHQFNQAFSGERRSEILERADEAERKSYRIKRDAFRQSRDGAKTSEILEYIAKARVRCPLLDADDRCELYAARPLTCRLYGIPTAIRGKAHTCPKAGFKDGEQYPTVHIEKLQDRLLALSAQLTGELRTRYARLAETLVPVSMALMNSYDDEYLGIMTDEEWEKVQTLKASLMRGDGKPSATSEPGGIAERAFGAQGGQDCASCGEQQGSDACGSCGNLNWEIGGPRE